MRVILATLPLASGSREPRPTTTSKVSWPMGTPCSPLVPGGKAAVMRAAAARTMRASMPNSRP